MIWIKRILSAYHLYTTLVALFLFHNRYAFHTLPNYSLCIFFIHYTYLVINIKLGGRQNLERSNVERLNIKITKIKLFHFFFEFPFYFYICLNCLKTQNTYMIIYQIGNFLNFNSFTNCLKTFLFSKSNNFGNLTIL